MESIISKIPNPCGRPPKFKSAKKLWSKFTEYIDWADANPVQTFNKLAASGDKQQPKNKTMAQMQVQRPYTLIGFITFAGIGNWCEFKQGKAHQTEDFSIVIRAIENTIQSQQIDGALVGVYNSNLTARLNGIADVTKNEVNTKVSVQQMSNEEIEAEIKRISESMSK